MPAAAVIPAPVAYIKVVAVKELVVGFLVRRVWPTPVRVFCAVRACHLSRKPLYPSLGRIGRSRTFTLKKLECLKQACAMNTLAWNNNLGLWSYFVGF